MTILVTGGKGKTSLPLAHLLKTSNIPFLLASRRGQSAAPEGMTGVTFDWDMPSTYTNPFTHSQAVSSPITSIYLITPPTAKPSPAITAFAKVAKSHGVERIVMMSGNNTRKGVDLGFGVAWQEIQDMGIQVSVVLCTWFMDNFVEAGSHHVRTIKEENRIYSAMGKGKSPIVSAADIAAVAYHALTVDAASLEESYYVKGPELLNYDDVASALTRVLGRKIEHVKLEPEEMESFFVQKQGWDKGSAKFMVWLETETKAGKEALENDTVEKVTGKKPVTLEAWLQRKKDVLL